MKLVFTKSLALSGLVLLAVSCGKPKVVTPESTKLNLPEFNNGTNFRLADNAEEQEFNGALVLWDKKLTSDKIVPLLQATRAYNESFTEYAKSLADVIDNQVSPSEKAMLEKKSVLEKLTAENSKKQLDVSMMAAANWFDNELKVKAENSPTLDVAKAKAVFARYCDAKVVEYASTKSLARESYSRRPSPAALCENYYVGRLFDVNSAECAPAAEGQTKNYLSCFWNEGVLKTSYFGGANRLFDDKQIEDIKVLVNEESFKQSLKMPGDADTVSCRRLSYLNNPTGAVPAREMSRNIFAQFLGFTQGTTQIISGATNYLKHYKLQCGSTLATFYFAPTSLIPMYATTPNNLISKVELMSSDDSDDMRIIGSKASDGSAQLPDLIEFRNKLKIQIAGLSQLNQSCAYPLEIGSGKLVTEMASVNELRFNGPLRAQAISCPDADKALVPDVFGSANTELDAAKVEFSSATQVFEKAREAVCFTHEQTCDESRLSLLQYKDCKANTELFAKKVAAVQAPNVAASVSKMTLNVKQMGDDGVQFLLKIGERPYGAACIDSFSSGKNIACASEVKVSYFNELNFNYNPTNSNISISTELNNVDFLKKSPTISHVVNLMDDAASEILGKTLKIELYPNSFDGVVPYLSGKALILDGDKEIYQGAGSYLIADSMFAKKQSQSCK